MSKTTVSAPASHSGRRSSAFRTWCTRGQYRRQVATNSRVLLLCAPPMTMTTSLCAANSMAAPWRCFVGWHTVSMKSTSDRGKRCRTRRTRCRTRSMGCVVCAATPNRGRSRSAFTSASVSTTSNFSRSSVNPRTSTWSRWPTISGWQPCCTSLATARCAKWTSGQVASVTSNPRSRTLLIRRSDAPCAVIMAPGVVTDAGSCSTRMPFSRSAASTDSLCTNSPIMVSGCASACRNARAMASRTPKHMPRCCARMIFIMVLRVSQACIQFDFALQSRKPAEGRAAFIPGLFRTLGLPDDLFEQVDVIGEGFAAGGGQ